MSPKRPDSAEPAREDVPRVGFICGLYQPGHQVHYVAALKRSPDLTPLSARIEVNGEEFLLLTGDNASRVFTHNPVALRTLLAELGEACAWYPPINLARWQDGGVRHWVNLSTEPLAPCASLEQVRLAEEEAWS